METVLNETWLLAGVGVVLLLFGRKIFWLVVAVAGAVFAYRLTAGWAETQETALLIALVAAGLGAFLAFVIQKLAIRVVGFILGAGGTAWLLDAGVGGLTWPEANGLALLVLVVGGFVGVLLVGGLFELVLIVLSALVGAGLILGPFPLEGVVEAIVFGVLAVIGMLVQSGGGPRRRRRRE